MRHTRYIPNTFLQIVLLACLLLTGCGSASEQTSQQAPQVKIAQHPTHSPTQVPTENDLAKRIVSRMSLEEKLGQMVIVEFSGETVSSDVQQMLSDNHISGMLIENKNGNAQNANQLMALNKDLQAKSHIPLFITTDYEGGVVNELRQITGEQPSEASIGASHNPQVAYNAGNSAAKELRKLGLNVNFMPIVDVLTNPNNPGLPERTFGSDPTLVTNMGRAYLKGLTAGGVVGCLKHFPGLGSADLDPHLALPTMNRSLHDLNTIDLVPYRTMINEGIVPMVMVTHISNPQLDPTLPTSLSYNVVTKLLRQQLNFKGVIISDTLWMGGVSNTYDLPQAAVKAVQAGTDLLLGPRTLTETQNMLTGLQEAVKNHSISTSQLDASVQRIIELKITSGIISPEQASRLATA